MDPCLKQTSHNDLYQEYFSKNPKEMSFEERAAFSSIMRRQYMDEVAALKAKLKLLRNRNVTLSDGKRLRQRSESEPGYSNSSSYMSTIKRARDNSPSHTYRYHRRLPLSPALSNYTRNQGTLNFNWETYQPKNVSICTTKTDVSSFESDEESNQGGDEERSSYESDDDDFSIKSVTTTKSTDSNTSSRVGEVLSSISLAEKVPSPQEINRDLPILRPSIFSNVPPYVRFYMHDEKGPTLPYEITKHLKWRLSSITPIVVRKTLSNSGFRLVRKSNEWTGQWGKHMNSFVFKTLKDYQKLNHFPGTFQIGRKDRLWRNLQRLMIKFGKKEFWFMPTTYILPQESKALRNAWEKCGGKDRWIIKPPAAARGAGIRVINRWAQIPKNMPIIVQKYISQPYLINGSKFDLRLYVLMTSIHPLRIYLYDDGLVRFASVKYSEDTGCLDDRYMHLTNYSINKLSNQYCANEDASSCKGHKWTLKSLWTYMEQLGVNVSNLRESLTELIIKTIISGEQYIQQLTKNNLPSRYNSYELFGIDVLLDSKLRMWLLEVNISPSLHSSSPLDLAVKGPLVQELFNIAGFHMPPSVANTNWANDSDSTMLAELGEALLVYDSRIYENQLSRADREKHTRMISLPRSEYLTSILKNLTSDDVRQLIKYEDELTQINRFQKIFPTRQTYKYHKFFDSPRYYNQLLDAWEYNYSNDIVARHQILENLCQNKFHLEVPYPGGKTKIPNQTAEDEEEEQVLPFERKSFIQKQMTGRRKLKLGVLAKPQLRAPPTPVRRTRACDLLLDNKSTITNVNLNPSADPQIPCETPDNLLTDYPLFPLGSTSNLSKMFLPTCKMESSIETPASSVVKITDY